MSKKKTKRPMSGYNCYMRECALDTGNFGKCLTDRGWSELSDKKKEEYNKKAIDGCKIT